MTLFFLGLLIFVASVLLAEWWALDQMYDYVDERKSTKRRLLREEESCVGSPSSRTASKRGR
jgi:hypothetical protein